MSQVRMMQTSPGRALDDHAEREESAVEHVVVGGQSLPGSPDDETPEEKLERQGQDEPEDAHAEQLRRSSRTDGWIKTRPHATQGECLGRSRAGFRRR
jgi:hypothetical protein